MNSWSEVRSWWAFLNPLHDPAVGSAFAGHYECWQPIHDRVALKSYRSTSSDRDDRWGYSTTYL
ncbi:MAG TPA: hypothetical protein V6C85_03005 [Allocoleopsis sp.]